jgi:hypothetical protein
MSLFRRGSRDTDTAAAPAPPSRADGRPERTEAEDRAARRLIEATYDETAPKVPFHELAREEQRKMLRVVHSDDQ